MIEITFVESDSERRSVFQQDWNQYLAQSYLDAKMTFVSGKEEQSLLFGEVLIIDLSDDGEKMFALAENYRYYNPDGLIILLSDDNDYALRGYSISAYRYYLHPISYETFVTAMDEIRAKLMLPNPYYVFIQNGDKMKKIYLKDIFSISEKDHQLYFITKFGTYVTDSSLEKIRPYYSHYNFFQLNKRVLVNLENIQSYQNSSSYASLSHEN